MARAVPLILLCACAARWDIEPSAPCDEVGFAIASRIHACAGDGAAANAAYDDFQKATSCQASGNPKRTDFACAVSITSLRCNELDVDWPIEAWLDDPSCAPLLGLDGDTGVSR